jgi:FkbM family methyltransferase
VLFRIKKVIVAIEAKWLGLTSPRRLPIGTRLITLNTNCRHEVAYYRYLTRNSFLSSVEMDLQVARRCIPEGGRVLDVGANIGFNTLQYAEAGAARVDAFEPTPELLDRLRVYEDDVIHIHPVALSNHAGEMSLFLSKDTNQGSTLDAVTSGNREVFGETPNAVKVRVETIDALFPDVQFDFVKLDIEGHELEALKGAERMLAERPPRYLQTESYAEKFPELHGFLSRHFQAAARLAVEPASRKLQYLDPTTGDGDRPDLRLMPPTYLYARSRSDAFWLQ